MSESSPVYLRTILDNGNGEITDIRQITDLEQISVMPAHLGYIGENYSVQAQLNENETFTGHPVTSLGTQWYDDAAEGTVSAQGTLMQPADGGGREAILLKPYEGPVRKQFSVPAEIHIPADGEYRFRFGNSNTGAPSGS